MKSILLVVLLISICWAEKKESAVQPRPVRAPQGHIQYSDPDGLKVNWKLYSPYSQWRSHLEEPERNERAESGTAQPTLRPYQGELIRPVTANFAAPKAAPTEKPVQPVHQVQVQYKPYSMVPTHIKQLMQQMYEPQVPYVDPDAFIYRPHRQLEQEQQRQQASSEREESSAQATSLSQLENAQPQYEHIPKFQPRYPYNKPKVGLGQYADDQPTYATTASPQYGSVPRLQQYSSEEQQQESSQQQRQQQPQKQDDGMPKEIHELLNLQAQIPYHVLADRIVYKPKSMFIPKPFKGDPKSPYKYRSKIYYIKNDEKEEQKNKERKEREQPKESAEQEQEQEQEQELEQQEEIIIA